MSTVANHFELIGGAKVAVFESYVDNESFAKSIATYRSINDIDQPFGVLNLNTVVEHFRDWKQLLPRVEPFYAMKCNDDPVLLAVLADLGAGYDCASDTEIDMILNDIGAPPEKIIFANPCKPSNHIAFARKNNVNMMTFDCEEELYKIAKFFPDAELVLRINVTDPTAQNPFLGLKFGCEPAKVAPMLLQKARFMNLRIIGISFHVGSGCNDPTAFQVAISHARNLFNLGKTLGFEMNLLDIGGGFPGNNPKKFEKLARIVRDSLDEHFPPSESVRIIAEPGRYFSAACVSVASKVIAVKKVPASKITMKDGDSEKDGYMYYMNDGIFGSFNSIYFDNCQPRGRRLFGEESLDNKLYPTSLWGPTCHSIDRVENEIQLPKLEVGEWLYYDTMGAYTRVSATNFNGFAPPAYYYFLDAFAWNYIHSQGQTSTLGA